MSDTLPVSDINSIYDDAMTQIYQLMFADHLADFKDLETFFPELFAEESDKLALSAIAYDKDNESRVRILAFRRLKEMGITTDEKNLLGVIIENHFKDGGMDTLAIYADGQVRYINQANKLVVSEHAIDKELQAEVFKLSQNILPVLGPWDKPRLPPPAADFLRVTFLVNGDIYFGQAPTDVAFEDEMMAPIANAMLQVLLKTIEKASNSAEE
ncbi:MAG: hypothetical protein IKJ44_00080 [Elusimicrobiaceae bacterium]|nr:hypothetical protein [Elusimicrobiaceae bacterium]